MWLLIVIMVALGFIFLFATAPGNKKQEDFKQSFLDCNLKKAFENSGIENIKFLKDNAQPEGFAKICTFMPEFDRYYGKNFFTAVYGTSRFAASDVELQHSYMTVSDDGSDTGYQTVAKGTFFVYEFHCGGKPFTVTDYRVKGKKKPNSPLIGDRFILDCEDPSLIDETVHAKLLSAISKVDGNVEMTFDGERLYLMIYVHNLFFKDDADGDSLEKRQEYLEKDASDIIKFTKALYD